MLFETAAGVSRRGRGAQVSYWLWAMRNMENMDNPARITGAAVFGLEDLGTRGLDAPAMAPSSSQRSQKETWKYYTKLAEKQKRSCQLQVCHSC